MSHMFSNYKSATLSHSPCASGPDNPSPQKSKTVIYHKFCHAKQNEYLSDFFYLNFSAFKKAACGSKLHI